MTEAVERKTFESSQESYGELRDCFVKEYGWFIPALHEKYIRVEIEEKFLLGGS
jgi:hypothetical protein